MKNPPRAPEQTVRHPRSVHRSAAPVALVACEMCVCAVADVGAIDGTGVSQTGESARHGREASSFSALPGGTGTIRDDAGAGTQYQAKVASCIANMMIHAARCPSAE